jgi:hypothetical protein
MNTIITKLRDLVTDNYKYTPDIFEYKGISKIFTLTEANIDVTSLACYKNGTLWAPANYSYNVTTGKVTVTGTLASGDILEFVYNAYEKYSDTELKGYIRAAITYLATEKYGIFTAKSDDIIFPTPTEAEENLIALIASIITNPPISSYRTPELSINFPGSSTKEEKIKLAIRQFKKTFGCFKYIKLDETIELPKQDV